jgi:hypothetical protein
MKHLCALKVIQIIGIHNFTYQFTLHNKNGEKILKQAIFAFVLFRSKQCSLESDDS